MREAVLSVGDAGLSALGIDELVSLARSAGIRDFEELECRGGGAVVQVEVESPLDEERLGGLAYVNWWERVSSDACRYVISFDSPALSGEIDEHASDMVGDCDPEVGTDGATMSFVGPQDAIRGAVEEYQSAGASPDLRKLGTYEGGEEPLDRLTDRQREVVETAHDMGYYEVPRDISTADVAAELDLDPSTVAEHLQRAERNLLDRVLPDQ